MQNYPPQIQDLAVSPISHQLSICFEFRVFSRFTAFIADVLYENVSKTRKARKRVHFGVHGANEQNPYTCTIL